METVNKLSPKENFGTFCHKKAKGAGDEGFEAKAFNPITYGILSFRQLRGGGFLARIQKTRLQLTD